jgi:hypothetical protein
MAGSYRHVTNDDGSFRGTNLLDHMGDAYEALDECHRMIRWLARGNASLIEQSEVESRPSAPKKQDDVFRCRYCGKQVDFTKPYHSDTAGLWHWNCGGSKS